MVVEDPDAPLPQPVVHGIYYDLPRDKTRLENDDFAPIEGSEEEDRLLTGGFRYGLNRRRTVWSGPRPVMGHGVHRYFFQIVGLSGPLGATNKKERGFEKQEVLEALVEEEKVVCWGEWIGTFERRLRKTS